MSSPTMWVPGRGISVSLHSNERPERDAVPEPQIDVRAVAEVGGEVATQRQVTIEIRAEIARVEAHGRPPPVHAQLQTVVARQVDLGDFLEKVGMRLLQEGDQRHAALHLRTPALAIRSEEHTSELQSRLHLVCRLLLEKKKKKVSMLGCHYC